MYSIVQLCSLLFHGYIIIMLCVYIYIYWVYPIFRRAHTHRRVMEPLKKNGGDLDMKYGSSAIRKQLRVGAEPLFGMSHDGIHIGPDS